MMMAMRILARKTLTAFVASTQSDQEAAKSAFDAWYHEAEQAQWRTPADVKAHYRSASFVGERVVFNIKGNDYRLVVAIDYGRQIAFIKWVGTHGEYDKIDVRTVQYGD
jgi:mRNA interferase HigB